MQRGLWIRLQSARRTCGGCCSMGSVRRHYLRFIVISLSCWGAAFFALQAGPGFGRDSYLPLLAQQRRRAQSPFLFFALRIPLIVCSTDPEHRRLVSCPTWLPFRTRRERRKVKIS